MEVLVTVKKLITSMIIIIYIIMLTTGCASSELDYNANLGFDLNKVRHKDITFNVYHSNKEDNSWEQIASFPCTPQPGHYNDVKLECKPGQITAVLKDSTYTESEDGNFASYDGTIEATYEFKIDKYKGSLAGWKDFEIKDIDGEQLVRLYPITNNGEPSFLAEISLDKPYNQEDSDNIDNILVTIVMK